MPRASALSGPTPPTPSPSPSARTASTPQTARKEANKQVKAPAPAGGPGSGDTPACPNSAAHGEIPCPRLELTGHGGHAGTSEGTERHSDQPERVLAEGCENIGGHPDTSAQVSGAYQSRGVTCRLCPAVLHRVALPEPDEWGWAGEDGRRFGDDPDVAHLKP